MLLLFIETHKTFFNLQNHIFCCFGEQTITWICNHRWTKISHETISQWRHLRIRNFCLRQVGPESGDHSSNNAMRRQWQLPRVYFVWREGHNFLSTEQASVNWHCYSQMFCSFVKLRCSEFIIDTFRKRNLQAINPGYSKVNFILKV